MREINTKKKIQKKHNRVISKESEKLNMYNRIV
jgi:hypothetical protein